MILVLVSAGCSVVSGVVGPIEVIELAYYRDGGSTGIRAVDARGREFSLCFDGSMVSRTPSRIYFGVYYARDAGGELLPEGSGDERAVLALLQGWVDSHLTRERHAELSGRHLEAGVSQEERWAFRILHAFEGQENVRRGREWLDANYSREEQARLLRRPDGDGLSERDQKAWHRIQSLHGYPVRLSNRTAR